MFDRVIDRREESAAAIDVGFFKVDRCFVVVPGWS
jgi:hypothetical protein